MINSDPPLRRGQFEWRGCHMPLRRNFPNTAPFLYNPRKIPELLINLRARVQTNKEFENTSQWQRHPKNKVPQWSRMPKCDPKKFTILVGGLRVAWGGGITAGWGETEVFMEVSSRRLAIVQHCHLPAHGLLSLFSLLSAFSLTGIKRNQVFFSSVGFFFWIAFWRSIPLRNRVIWVALPLRSVLRFLIGPHPRSQFH